MRPAGMWGWVVGPTCARRTAAAAMPMDPSPAPRSESGGRASMRTETDGRREDGGTDGQSTGFDNREDRTNERVGEQCGEQRQQQQQDGRGRRRREERRGPRGRRGGVREGCVDAQATEEEELSLAMNHWAS